MNHGLIAAVLPPEAAAWGSARARERSAGTLDTCAFRRFMVEAERGSLRLRFEDGLSPEYNAAILRAVVASC
jgi:hypothetical protein